MKKAMFSLVPAALVAAAAVAQTTQWKVDKSHAGITFAATHMLISEVVGEFKKFDGTALSDKEDFTDAKIEFSADAASISTDNDMRDGHLKSDDFFNAEKYPQITFRSTSLKKVKGNQYRLTGDLTIRDVTKTVIWDVTFRGTAKDGYGNTRAGFKVTGSINRFDYGLKWNKAMEAGGLVVSETVEVVCHLELIRQK